MANLEGGAVGDPALAIGMDGLPVISYGKFERTTVTKVVKCGDLACSSGNVTTIVDPTTNGEQVLEVLPDGRPVLFQSIGHVAKMARCGNPSCSAGNKVIVLAGLGYPIPAMSMDLVNGLPLIAGQATNGSGQILTFACKNPGCD